MLKYVGCRRGHSRASLCPLTWLAAAGVLAACEPHPPDQLADVEESLVYGRILRAVRQQVGTTGPIAIHPFLAVGTDSLGRPTPEIRDFEYVDSEPLRLLAQRDPTLRLCWPDSFGRCNVRPYLILTQLTRISDRDAIVRAIWLTDNRTTDPRWLKLDLRYGRNGWIVVR